jgi:hypothetical protein
VSGNPRGRPRLGTSLAERVREVVDPGQIFEFLQSTVFDSKARLDIRVKAAEVLLDRGWGKPVQTIDVEASVEARAVPSLAGVDLSALTDAELETWLALAQNAAATTSDSRRATVSGTGGRYHESAMITAPCDRNETGSHRKSHHDA